MVISDYLPIIYNDLYGVSTNATDIPMRSFFAYYWWSADAIYLIIDKYDSSDALV